jgi:hypothetical protein
MALVSMRHTLAALRVLVVLPSPPLPEGGAAARCALALLLGLRSLDVECRALAANVGSLPLEGLPAGLDVETISLAPVSPWQGRRDRLLSPHGLLARGEFAARVQELSRTVDIAHFVEPQAAVAIRHSSAPAPREQGRDRARPCGAPRLSCRTLAAGQLR